MIYGSVLGSFTCERIGLARLRRLTRGQIHRRARAFYRLTHFTL
jgi:hypothetical protein